MLIPFPWQESDGGMTFQPAAKFAPIMDKVFAQLSER